MKKAIAILALVNLSSVAHADADWIAPLLGGMIIGNTFSSPRPNYNYYPAPTYIYTPPPVQYVVPAPPVYSYRQRGCGSYPIYDDYGYYVGQHQYCW